MKKHIQMFFAIVITSTLFGCCIYGSGDVEEEIRFVGPFQNLSVDVPGTVYVSYGETDEVQIRTDDNVMDRIEAEVRGNTLYIETDPPSRCVDPTTLHVYVSTTSIRNIDVDGSGDVVIEDPFEAEAFSFSIDGSGDIVSRGLLYADRLDVDIDGSGEADLYLDVIDLQTTVDGSGDLFYTGIATYHDILINGSGNVRAYDLGTAVTHIDIDGSGDCQVTVAEELNVNIDGSGNVSYRGQPVVTQRIDGSGTIRNTN